MIKLDEIAVWFLERFNTQLLTEVAIPVLSGLF